MNFQTIQNIQQDIIELKVISSYKDYDLNQELLINQLKGVTKNLEDHLEELINNTY